METSKLAQRVRAFHERFGHPIRETPTIPGDPEVRFRLRLIAEEFKELLHATFEADEELWDNLTSALDAIVDDCHQTFVSTVDVKLPDFIDALGDLEYVEEGTRLCFGVNGELIGEEIQRANMEKVPNGLAKPTKPATWLPPDIIGVLCKQGWVPFRTGDVVFHRPTGETWLVAYMEDDCKHVAPCGWPFCLAPISDCVLKEPASDANHIALVKELAAMSSDGSHDMRRAWAIEHMKKFPEKFA